MQIATWIGVGWNRGTACLLLISVWALIYLPALGSIELRGEEGRRILPAISMLENGQWLVPKVGGEFYYKKPPLIQWLIASSFEITGVRSDFTARLPSALAVLVFGLILIGLPLAWLPLNGRFVAALIFLTNLGLVTKGRLIEIEALLISLTGITAIVWLHLFARGASPVVLWGTVGLLTGAGLLLKGPIILLFLYGLVLPVAIVTGRGRELRRPGPWLGLALAAAVFLVWVLLAMREAPPEAMAKTWFSEISEQASASDGMNLGHWLVKLVKTLGNFMPWLLLLPLLWMPSAKSAIAPPWWNLFRGCRWSLAACFCLVFFVPGSMPRYSMPVIPLASLLLGWVLSTQTPGLLAARAWRWLLLGIATLAALAAIVGWFRLSPSSWAILLFAALSATAAFIGLQRSVFQIWPRLAWMTGWVTGLGMLLYALYGVPLAREQESRRPTAETLNQAIPAGEKLYVYRAQSLPMLFYLRRPFAFVNQPGEIGASVRYLLVRQTDAEPLRQSLQAAGRSVQTVQPVKGRRVGSFDLLYLGGDPGR